MKKLIKIPCNYTGFAVIGGSGAYDITSASIGKTIGRMSVKTPFGLVEEIRYLSIEETGTCLAFISRHGWKRYEITAPDINYRANIWALKEIGTKWILSWSGPGAVDTNYHPGDYVLPDDLLDLTKNRENTFYKGTGLGFIRQNPVFCPQLREILLNSLKSLGVKYHIEAVYAVTEGPRLETPAEISMIKKLGGHLVGMTLAPEAFLARELEMCYHPCCYVANWAEGVKKLPFKAGELFEGMLDNKYRKKVDNAVLGFAEIIRSVSSAINTVKLKKCPCVLAMERYRRSGRIGEDWRSWINRKMISD